MSTIGGLAVPMACVLVRGREYARARAFECERGYAEGEDEGEGVRVCHSIYL